MLMRGLTLDLLFEMRDGLENISSAACWERKTIAALSNSSGDI